MSILITDRTKIPFEGNGKEAIEYYDRIKEYPDVSLMDHRMPIKNGISACEYILETNRKQQIIFISADDSVKTQIERMGIKFLTKPFSFKLLANIIENELLRGKK